MTENRPGGVEGRFEVRVTAESHFSWLRTRLSVERTLMSWIRTSTALIGFGFAIFQFLDKFNATAGVAPALQPRTPRYFGLALIGAGVIALLVAVQEYRTVVRYLWSADFAAVAGTRRSVTRTPVVWVAGLLVVIGLLTFGAVLLRLP